MTIVLKLKLVPIDNSGKVQSAGQKYFVVDSVSDEENAKGQRPLFVILRELFLVLFHELKVMTDSSRGEEGGLAPLPAKKTRHRLTRITQIRKDNVQSGRRACPRCRQTNSVVDELGAPGLAI